jgi:hypothetical protein
VTRSLRAAARPCTALARAAAVMVLTGSEDSEASARSRMARARRLTSRWPGRCHDGPARSRLLGGPPAAGQAALQARPGPRRSACPAPAAGAARAGDGESTSDSEHPVTPAQPLSGRRPRSGTRGGAAAGTTPEASTAAARPGPGHSSDPSHPAHIRPSPRRPITRIPSDSE